MIHLKGNYYVGREVKAKTSKNMFFFSKKHAEPTENPTSGIVNFITGEKKIKQKKILSILFTCFH